MTFTPSQQAAVDSIAPITLAMAGAGSGKTATMVAFIGKQIADGIAPTNISALTFTRRAAMEMRERIGRALGDDDAFNGAMTGTMHAVCFKILQAYGDRVGYDGTTLGIIDPEDADALLEQCASDLGLFRAGKWGKGLSASKVRAVLDFCYANADEPTNDEPGRIIRAYWNELRQLNLMDFGLILYLVNRLFDEHPDVLETYRKRIRVITIDEAQDLDAIQHAFLFKFPDARLFLAGDLRQSIYAWRNARPELLRSIAEKHPPIDLCENFRSGRAVVEAANRLIACGPDQVAPMVAAKPDDGMVEAMPGRTDDIVTRVRIAAGVFGPGNCAVIARSHRTLRRIEGRMKDAGVPCYRVGQRWDITDTPEFKTLHRAMRLAVNPRDQLAFMLLLDQFGMTTKDYAMVRARASLTGKPILMEAAGWGGQLIGMIQSIAKTDSISTGVTVHKLAAPIFSHRSVVDFWSPVADLPLKDALDWYATRDRDAENEDAPKDKVVLMTCHAAKGLEFPFVMIAECNESSFPSSSAIREGTIDDERRVFYVAMTRAKDVLVLHYRRECDHHDGERVNPPSRFLFESGILSKD